MSRLSSFSWILSHCWNISTSLHWLGSDVMGHIGLLTFFFLFPLFVSCLSRLLRCVFNAHRVRVVCVCDLPLSLLSHARLRCMCTCNRCTFCLCQNFLNSELLQTVRAKLYAVVLRRSSSLFWHVTITLCAVCPLSVTCFLFVYSAIFLKLFDFDALNQFFRSRKLLQINIPWMLLFPANIFMILLYAEGVKA